MKANNFWLIIFFLFYWPFEANAGIQVMSKMTERYTAKKGETYTSQIQLYNTGNKEQEVKIYQQDYLYNYKGETKITEPVSHKRSNSNWIHYSPQNMILKGQEIQNIKIEITVPQNDTLTGTYWSLVMVEEVKKPDPNATGQLVLNESFRYAIQIVTNIENSGSGQLEFQNPGIIKEGDKNIFDFVLFNTGERFLSPNVSMELFDEATGQSVAVLKAPKNGMYPTTSTLWKFPLEGLPVKKPLKAVIVADCSGEDVFGLEYTILIQ